MCDPEYFLMVVKSVPQQPHGGCVGFSPACRQDHQRAVAGRFIDDIKVLHSFFLMVVKSPFVFSVNDLCRARAAGSLIDIDKFSAGIVDDDDSVLHLHESILVDHTGCTRQKRSMDGDNIRLFVQSIEVNILLYLIVFLAVTLN